jgi:Na+/H+ antiporter NhaD/arsenite permease-like protein
MKNNFTRETILAFGTIIALLLLINPWGWFMSDMLVMSLTCVAAILFLWFISFVFRENAHDEREELHRYIAARLGYFGGTSVLMAMIVVSEFQHTENDALVYALGAMLFMKVVGAIYAKQRY